MKKRALFYALITLVFFSPPSAAKAETAADETFIRSDLNGDGTVDEFEKEEAWLKVRALRKPPLAREHEGEPPITPRKPR